MEAYAKYLVSSGNSQTIAATVLGAAVTNTFAIPPSETVLINGINSNAAASAAFIQAGTSEPKAYLIYLFFDDNKAFQWGAASPVTTAAYKEWQKLSRSFTANKDGTLFIYVASESNVAAADVYFDDFYIVHQKNNTALQVLQASDYYPYGLSFNEYQADRLQSVGGGNYEPILRN